MLVNIDDGVESGFQTGQHENEIYTFLSHTTPADNTSSHFIMPSSSPVQWCENLARESVVGPTSGGYGDVWREISRLVLERIAWMTSLSTIFAFRSFQFISIAYLSRELVRPSI